MRARRVCIHHEAFDIYVGRGGPWGNPYTHLPILRKEIIAVVDTPEEACARYREHLWERIREEERNFEGSMGPPPIVFELAKMHGKRLGCYCKETDPCHGDVLVAAAEWAAQQVEPFVTAHT